MKTVALTQGKVALVDDEDFDLVNQFKWFAAKNDHVWYAHRNSRRDGKRVTIAMHSTILPHIPRIDHRDRDGLNNQKSNLRAANHSQNNMNKIGWGRVGMKGVKVHSKVRRKPFQARIQIANKSISLGYFSKVEEAALAYNKKALELFGEFARLNPVYG